MARIRLSPIITHIAGSIGSATFQKSGSGLTLRSKPIARKYSTPLQYEMRSIMSMLHASWSGLDPSQVQKWIDIAKYVNAKCNNNLSAALSAHSLFIKYNFLRYISGPYPAIESLPALPQILIEPTYNFVGLSPYPYQIQYNAGYLYVSLRGQFQPFNHWFVLKLSNHVSAGAGFSLSGLRKFTFARVSSTGFESYYSSVQMFGNDITVGEKVNYSLQAFDLYCPHILPPVTGQLIIKVM
jgi:hypothetical protein